GITAQGQVDPNRSIVRTRSWNGKTYEMSGIRYVQLARGHQKMRSMTWVEWGFSRYNVGNPAAAPNCLVEDGHRDYKSPYDGVQGINAKELPERLRPAGEDDSRG
ncbi:MAG: hypothetical protein AAF203_05890, partial [Pseudomonadota bacterium]